VAPKKSFFEMNNGCHLGCTVEGAGDIFVSNSSVVFDFI